MKEWNEWCKESTELLPVEQDGAEILPFPKYMVSGYEGQ